MKILTSANTYHYVFFAELRRPSSFKEYRKFELNSIVKKPQIKINKKELIIMAGCLSKSKELLRLIPDLQCHNCKSVPGPNENQKNRYSCLNENSSHILCEEHKNKCPCGSKVGNCLATN